ncbi:hypothetical protein D3C84_589680 [compost metagenome]
MQEAWVGAIEGALQGAKDMPTIIGDSGARINQNHFDSAGLVVQCVGNGLRTGLQSVIESLQFAMQQIFNTVAELRDIA